MSAIPACPFPLFVGPVKPFCPCDTGRPQDCQPENWPGAHAHRDCERCGAPSYQHGHWHGLLFCRPAKGDDK